MSSLARSVAEAERQRERVRASGHSFRNLIISQSRSFKQESNKNCGEAFFVVAQCNVRQFLGMLKLALSVVAFAVHSALSCALAQHTHTHSRSIGVCIVHCAHALIHSLSLSAGALSLLISCVCVCLARGRSLSALRLGCSRCCCSFVSFCVFFAYLRRAAIKTQRAVRVAVAVTVTVVALVCFTLCSRWSRRRHRNKVSMHLFLFQSCVRRDCACVCECVQVCWPCVCALLRLHVRRHCLLLF